MAELLKRRFEALAVQSAVASAYYDLHCHGGRPIEEVLALVLDGLAQRNAELAEQLGVPLPPEASSFHLSAPALDERTIWVLERRVVWHEGLLRDAARRAEHELVPLKGFAR